MVNERSETSPPTQDLFAFGAYYNTIGATKIATENAADFCYRWRMVPAIKNKQVAERGVLPPNALAEIASNENIPTWSPSMAKWEVR